MTHESKIDVQDFIEKGHYEEFFSDITGELERAEKRKGSVANIGLEEAANYFGMTTKDVGIC
jgi:hypothetical protein